jgi:hypothetical protein
MVSELEGGAQDDDDSDGEFRERDWDALQARTKCK